MTNLFQNETVNLKNFVMIDNYLYLYHLEEYVILPCYPDNVSDSQQINFANTSVLSRTAPIYSYSNAGPRTLQVQLPLHRELFTHINYGASKFSTEVGEDYVDSLIKKLQAAALPKFSDSAKMINPPIVAMRFGNDLYIKGVINGSVTTGYSLPIIGDGKYANVNIGFSISEIEPYDAEYVSQNGSFRGLDTTLEKPTHGLMYI
jgi:hypothetical protein